MCGPTGVGKSHLANAIDIVVIKHNFKVIVKTTHCLLLDLQISRANGTYPRLLARILKCDLLGLDDFALQYIPSQSTQDLFEFVLRTIRTSFNHYYQQFGF
jgi:DNA replication protein DnaC